MGDSRDPKGASGDGEEGHGSQGRMDRVQLSITQQQTEDLWKMGTLMWSPFVYLSKEKERVVETEVEAEERGEEADDEDKDAQGEEE